jgi:hypothetical protein
MVHHVIKVKKKKKEISLYASKIRKKKGIQNGKQHFLVDAVANKNFLCGKRNFAQEEGNR